MRPERVASFLFQIPSVLVVNDVLLRDSLPASDYVD